MIFVNFKTYKEASGESALQLTKLIEEASEEAQVKVVVAVQAPDIKEVVGSTKLEVWSQRVDSYDFGAHTGAILPEAVSEDGALGTFVNHSEAKITDFDELSKIVKRATEVGLKTLVFASDIAELTKVVTLSPTFVAYEPPELIGSRDASVAQKEPEVIAKAVGVSKEAKIPLIVGAGIKSAADIKKSLELGAVGVAIASDVVLAPDPKAELLELASGFN